MRTAVMQPYLLPYLGYYQLVNAVDVFIFYDDVDFMTRGYINRNAIWAHGKKLTFTVPLSKASQNVLIKDVTIHPHEYESWWSKFKRTLKENYGSAPCYDETISLLEGIFDTPGKTIAELAENSILSVSDYLGMTTEFQKSSELSYNREADAEKKILELCAIYEAGTYINPMGGIKLYSPENFEKKGMELRFLESRETSYPQKTDEFVPSLSIIDVLMYNDKAEILKCLDRYELIKKEQYGHEE